MKTRNQKKNKRDSSLSGFHRKFSTAGMSHLFCPNDVFQNFGPRKQIIGFARFNTQTFALKAIDTLNGRKIDPDRCSLVMKAELAKKNPISKKTLVESSLPVSGEQPIHQTESAHSPSKRDSLNIPFSTEASNMRTNGKMSLPCLPLVSGQLYQKRPKWRSVSNWRESAV